MSVKGFAWAFFDGGKGPETPELEAEGGAPAGADTKGFGAAAGRKFSAIGAATRAEAGGATFLGAAGAMAAAEASGVEVGAAGAALKGAGAAGTAPAKEKEIGAKADRGGGTALDGAAGVAAAVAAGAGVEITRLEKSGSSPEGAPEGF